LGRKCVAEGTLGKIPSPKQITGRQDIVPSLELDYSYLLLLSLQQSYYEGGGTGLLL